MADPRPGLRKLAKNRRFEELEAACLEEIEAGTADREELVSALTMTAHRAPEDFTDSLIWLSVTSWAERNGQAEALALTRELSALVPESALLREEVADIYRAVHGGVPGLEVLLSTVLFDAAVPLPEAIRRMDGLVSLPPGGYCRERAGKVGGRVRRFDGAAVALLVELGGEERAFEPAKAADLVPLDGEDFRALKAFEPERLKALAAEDPAGLVEKVLRSAGPRLPYRELRAQLADVVPGSWTAWWNAARPLVSRSAWIEVSTAAQPLVELRRTPLDPARRLRRDLLAEDAGVARLSVIIDYLDQMGDHAESEAELLREMGEILWGEDAGDDPALVWGRRALLGELAQREVLDLGDLDATPLPPVADPEALARGLPDPRLQRLVLALVRAEHEDTWTDIFARALPVCDPGVCEWAAGALVDAGCEEALAEVAATVMSNPNRFTPAFVWLWKESGAGGFFAERESIDRVTLFSRILAATDRAMRTPELQKVATRLRSALSSRRFETARSVLESTDREGASRVRGALDRCVSFSDDLRSKISDILVETHPRLFIADVPPWEMDDVIFTSRTGLERKQRELEHMVNVVLPGIADAIGLAAAQGDLSENAEYTAALEERERMTERANVLQAEIAKARVMYPEMAGDKMVTVGSRVRVRAVVRDGGEEMEFVFLGPWDVDYERGVFSYRAPLALAFMGRRAGETVTVGMDAEERRWEILEIGSGISSQGGKC